MAQPNEEKRYVQDWVADNKEILFELSDAIWSYAELGLEERRSADLLVDYMKKNDFEVKAGIGNLPTAFVATFGSGKPILAYNCEYDALPGLSQEPIPKRSPVVDGAPGHGCGHNLLGVGSIGAAIALKQVMTDFNISGTLKVLGSPAEEICVGKPFIVRDGALADVDAVLDWHPWSYNGANYDTCNAYFNIKYHFIGKTAHGNSPWYGRSSLDAAILQAHAVELLREHIPPGVPEAAHTINYTFSDVGPCYPNVVPDRSTSWYVGRISTSKEMEKVISRINDCAKAGALATGTECETKLITATHERIPNKTISRILYNNLKAIGLPNFTEGEIDFVRKIQREVGVPETGLERDFVPFEGGRSAVSDNSEYSWVSPFGRVRVAMAPHNIGWHNWQVTSLSRTTIGKKAMLVAAKVLASSGIDLLTDPNLIDVAQTEWKERLNGRTYKSLIPKEIMPPFSINKEIMDKYRVLQETHYQEVNFDKFGLY